MESVRTNNIVIFNYLISKDVNINVVDCNENTILHLAAYWGHYEFCKIILNLNININQKNKNIKLIFLINKLLYIYLLEEVI